MLSYYMDDLMVDGVEEGRNVSKLVRVNSLLCSYNPCLCTIALLTSISPRCQLE